MKRTFTLTDQQELGLAHVAGEQGQSPDDYVATLIACLADDWCRRMCAQDCQKVIEAIADPDKLAAAMTALEIE